MRRNTILILGAAALLAGPAAALADIVFDPTNFAEAVQQVSQDVQLVEQLRQQVQNQLSMLHGWGYTALPDLMKSMKVWQQLFDAPGSPYSSTSPGTSLNQQYPLEPGSYAETSDPAMQSMSAGWAQEERQELIENRTVQDDAYLQLQPTAQRIGAYVQHSNAASGQTAALQAGNEELATLIAQLQTMQSQEVTDARGEVEQDAREQAEAAYAQQQRSAVRAGWDAPQGPSSSLVDAFPQASN